MPKNLTASMRTHLAQTSTTLAMCWRLERRDGQVFTFTNHDRDLRVEDQNSSGTPTGVIRTYEAQTALDRTAIEQRGDMDAANLEATGAVQDEAVPILSSTLIQARDIEDGLWDDCKVDVFFVDHQDTSNAKGRVPLWSGFISTIVKTGGSFKAEMRSKALELRKDIIELTSPLCRADLGDARCQVNLANGFTQQGIVESVIDATTIRALGVTRTRLLGAAGSKDDGVTWKGSTTRLTRVTGNRGTPQRPILITTIAQFRAIANDPYAAYALDADLDFSGEAVQTADVIDTDFYGWFDGRGFTISNVNLGNQNTVGASRALFQRVMRGAVIRRLNVSGFASTLTGSSSEAGCIAQDVEGLVVDCRAIGHSLSAVALAGGIAIRTSNGGRIVRCFAQGQLLAASTKGAICATNPSGAPDRQVHGYFDSTQTNNGGVGTNGTEVGVPAASLGLAASFQSDTGDFSGLEEWMTDFVTSQGLQFGAVWDFDSTPKPRVRSLT